MTNWAREKLGELLSFLRAQLEGLREWAIGSPEGTSGDEQDADDFIEDLHKEAPEEDPREPAMQPPRRSTAWAGSSIPPMDMWAPTRLMEPRPGQPGRHRAPTVDEFIPSMQRTIPVTRTEDKPPWPTAEHPAVAEMTSQDPPRPPDPGPDPEPEAAPEPEPEEREEEHPWPRGLTGQFKALEGYLDGFPGYDDTQE